MAGLNGLVKAFKSDANVRAYKYTAYVKSLTNPSTQSDYYAALPTAANAAGPIGLLVDHFHEDNYFIPQPVGTPGSGTNYPENVTGSTPVSPWNLAGYPLNLLVSGEGYGIAGVAGINQGDPLIIADAYGRLIGLSAWITANGIAAGTTYNAIGYAEHGTSNLDDLILVRIDFFTGKT